MLDTPSLGDVIAAAGVAAAAVDGFVEKRSSAELPAPSIQGAVVPAVAGDDASAARVLVDPACASPASVPPTDSPDELLATAPAVPIAAPSDDQATLELSEVLAGESELSPAPPVSVAHSVAVDPTPADDVPPAAPATPVELSSPVLTLSKAWSASLDDGMEPETEPVAVVLVLVASQLAVEARAALVGDVDGAAEAQSLAVRMSSAASALADMVCSSAVAETRVSVLTEWLGFVWEGAELEPKLAVDVGASYPVSAPSMPGPVVSDEGEDAEVERVIIPGIVAGLVVPDAAGTAKLPADVADNGADSASSNDTDELV